MRTEDTAAGIFTLFALAFFSMCLASFSSGCGTPVKPKLSVNTCVLDGSYDSAFLPSNMKSSDYYHYKIVGVSDKSYLVVWYNPQYKAYFILKSESSLLDFYMLDNNLVIPCIKAPIVQE